jgi:assimilatory nitrate reductase catalytic subunit
LEIIAGLAAALGCGAGFAHHSEREVFDELRRATAGGVADYAGISYERLEASDGLFWPCPDESHPGTPRLFAERFNTPSGRARFHATPHRDIAEARTADYPLLLTTGRVLAHYQSGSQTRRVDPLQQAMPAPRAEIHPATAERVGLVEGAPVRLTSRRGQATFTTRITRTIREDTIFVPFHWGGEQCANLMTNDALDPVSRMPEFKVCAVRAEGLPDAAQ